MRAGARIFFCFVAFRSGLMPATRATLSDTDMSPGAEIFLIGIPSILAWVSAHAGDMEERTNS